jgi:ABC-type nickel/cobalt efflux system permease component RcnA
LGALLLLLVAFLYGVFHAIGPGHGKVFTLSYVCSEGSSLRKGVLLGILIAYMHAFSAVIVVMGMYYLFISLPLFKTSDTITYFVQTVSYGVIALLGLFLLVKKIVMVIKKMPDHGTTTSTASYWTLLFSLGMVPCPGTVIILLFAISIHKIALGLGMSFAMATGMALTLSCLGLSAALLKKGVSVTGRKIAFWVHGVEIFGSLLLFLIGLFLFFSYL